MKQFIALVIAASILGADAINHIQRTDGQALRVVQHAIERKQPASLLRKIQMDRERMRKRSSGLSSIPILNEEFSYFMSVTVGTPAQSMRLHLDTGSSDMWVNVANSDYCSGASHQCAWSGTYNANKSTTYNYLNSDFNITYVDSSGAAGDYVTDRVSFNGVTLRNQQFGIGYTSTSRDGILGIGYPSNEVAYSSNSGPYPNVPQSLVINGIIASNAYSLWLNDLDSNTGSILFGGVNTAKYTGTLQTLPIIKESGIYREFIIALTAIGANGVTGSISNNIAVSALLDSGSSLMYLPDDAAQKIFESVGAVYDEDTGAAPVDCSLGDSDQTVDFTFSAPTIRVSMRELVLSSGPDTCILGIGKAGNSGPVLGDAFIRSAYVVYDLTRGQISIAQAALNSLAKDNILEITNSTGVPNAVLVTNAVDSVTDAGSSRNGDSSARTSGAAIVTGTIVNWATIGLVGMAFLLAL